MTADQLRAIGRLSPGIAAVFADPMTAAMARFGITTPRDQAGFIAQALHESGGFTRMTENLDYKVEVLTAIWPRRFTPALAAAYGRTAKQKANQQMIANVAYADRMGNGGIVSGDGWRYRARGPGQLTGKDNYRRCGAALGLDLVAEPEQVALPEQGCLAFAWFWKANGLSELANAGQVDRVSARINGGDLGLQARRELTAACLKTLCPATTAAQLDHMLATGVLS